MKDHFVLYEAAEDKYQKIDVREAYIKRRKDFYERAGFLWPRTLNEPFDILDAVGIRRVDFENIRRAARSIIEIYRSIRRYVACVQEEDLLRMGIPATIVVSSRLKTGVDDLAFARLDLICSESGIKLLECNFDAPGLIVETFEINRLVCNEIDRVNPNHAGLVALKQFYFKSIADATDYIGKPQDRCEIAVCCRGEYSRDVEAAIYLTQQLNERMPRIRCVTLEACTMDELGLYGPDGEKIDVLIRMYPLGDLVRWNFNKKRAEGGADHCDLLALYAQRKLVTIGTPSATLLENKAIQALIWRMHEEGVGFTKQINRQISRYMLPTAFDPTRFVAGSVAKPVSGRGGSSIRILDRGNYLECARTCGFERDVFVYQEYWPVPEAPTMTEYGMRQLRFVASVWVIDGREIGVCYRAGEGITDAAWWIVPVFFKD